MTHNLSDIYKQYKKEGGTLDKQAFKNICCDFNIHIMNRIIEDGEVVDLGHNLSTISVKRVKRNYKKPAIDWNESLKYKQELINKGEKLYNAETGEGTKWFIYHTDPWYCRFFWNKKYVRIKNKSAYRFEPTRGEAGNMKKLKDLLKNDELQHLKYRSDGDI